LILSLALHLFNHSDFCASGGPWSLAGASRMADARVGMLEHGQGLEDEYRLLRELGVQDIELWDEARVKQQHPSCAGFVSAA
jgi:hypothetical protein